MTSATHLYPQRKQAGIIAAIFGWIISGRIKPGQQLPSQQELCRDLGSTPVTVSRAIQQLISLGVVRSEERQGVFLRDDAPSLRRYGLAFAASEPEDPTSWNRFFEALRQAATAANRSLPYHFTIYHDIDGRTGIRSYQRLLADIADYRITGLIFAASPWPAAHTTLVQAAGFPRVAVMPRKAFPHIPAITPDGSTFLDRALDHLHQQGRKRIAIIASGELGASYLDAFRAGVEARGMRTEAYWLQCPSITQKHAATSIAHLLLHAPRRAERPDGLVIADDNFTEFAISGIERSGVSVPTDLTVVAHCNFPHTGRSTIPIHRIGFDAADLLRRSAELLATMQRGETPPDVSRIEVVSEAELG